jgi:hypothetical protein
VSKRKVDRRRLIEGTTRDLVGELLYYGRKEDEELGVEEIQQAIIAGEITVEDIISVFATELTRHLKPYEEKPVKKTSPSAKPAITTDWRLYEMLTKEEWRAGDEPVVVNKIIVTHNGRTIEIPLPSDATAQQVTDEP